VRSLAEPKGYQTLSERLRKEEVAVQADPSSDRRKRDGTAASVRSRRATAGCPQ
jgi:hypothetical protein